MTSYDSRGTTPSPRTSIAQLQTSIAGLRRSSAPLLSTHASPRVQLIPYSRNRSIDASISPADQFLIDHTHFDSRDVSGKDFDFEDVFTYDRPQTKLHTVKEVVVSENYHAISKLRPKGTGKVKVASAAETYLNHAQGKRR